MKPRSFISAADLLARCSERSRLARSRVNGTPRPAAKEVSDTLSGLVHEEPVGMGGAHGAGYPNGRVRKRAPALTVIIRCKMRGPLASMPTPVSQPSKAWIP